MAGRFPADIGLLSDAAPAAAALSDALGAYDSATTGARTRAAGLRAEIDAALTDAERRHARVLDALDFAAPDDITWSCDPCQLVYTGVFKLPSRHPRRFFYPSGFCALGNALPNAIGAKLARPKAPVAVLVGDGGFLFTAMELLTAADLHLALPIVVWDNRALKQIRDDMERRQIPPVGVNGSGPDLPALARACHCRVAEPESAEDLQAAFTAALDAPCPTVIHLIEGEGWLA